MSRMIVDSRRVDEQQQGRNDNRHTARCYGPVSSGSASAASHFRVSTFWRSGRPEPLVTQLHSLATRARPRHQVPGSPPC